MVLSSPAQFPSLRRHCRDTYCDGRQIMEKVLLALLLMTLGALGWFVREMLSEIKGTQKEHGVSLTNIRNHVTKIEDKQSFLHVEFSKLRENVLAGNSTQQESKSVLDHNLYEMRQQIKQQNDELFEQKQNFGKIILIVQKLYAATKNGSSK